MRKIGEVLVHDCSHCNGRMFIVAFHPEEEYPFTAVVEDQDYLQPIVPETSVTCPKCHHTFKVPYPMAEVDLLITTHMLERLQCLSDDAVKLLQLICLGG